MDILAALQAKTTDPAAPETPAAPAATVVTPAAPAAPVTPVPATAVPPVEAAAGTPAATPAAAPPADDPFASIFATETAASVFNDAAKAAFKEHLSPHIGSDDPDTFINQYKNDQTRIAELSKVEATFKAREEKLAGLSPAAKLIVQAELAGVPVKPEDYQDAVGGDLNKPGAQMDKRALLNKEYPGKVSNDELQAYEDGDCDEATKAKVETYLPMAIDKHDKKRSEKIARAEAITNGAKEAERLHHAAIEAGIAHVSKTYPGLKARIDTPAFREGMASGNIIIDSLYNADGTYKPTAPLGLQILQDPEGFVASVKANALKWAKEQAELERMKGGTAGTRAGVGGQGSSEGGAADPAQHKAQGARDFLKRAK